MQSAAEQRVRLSALVEEERAGQLRVQQQLVEARRALEDSMREREGEREALQESNAALAAEREELLEQTEMLRARLGQTEAVRENLALHARQVRGDDCSV